ncbi:MAG: D-lactate dehydrogenase (cytochrome) [Myxococcota bacterium]|jgi:D-lactate dehydrogenase (cytochrome)
MTQWERITDPAIIDGYLTDASNTRGHAEVLVRPRSVEAVAEVLAHCQATATPVTVTARRTSTTGAPVPHGGWLLSTEHFDTIHGIEEVGGGVLLGAYQRFVAEQGRMFPPDPTSRHECTVGAAIACNASGARSYRYGPTRPWIEAIEVVLPDGTILPRVDRSTPVPDDWPRLTWSEPAVKTAAGYFPADNLLDLMIGQEGTLGVITRAWTRTVPAPVEVLSLIAFFTDLPTTLAMVERARTALSPRAIEFFDHNSLAMVRDRVPDIPEAARMALFIEIEHDGEPPLEAWWDALVECDALAEDTIVAEDERGRARLHAVRHAIPAGINEQVVANGMPKVGTDFAVPHAHLAAMVARYHAVPLRHVLFGHIGDAHLHLNMLPTTAAELVEARAIYRELALSAVALGGTVSAEHGIGKIKRELLAEMVGAQTLAEFHALKRHVDPAWILGRGTMLTHSID